MTKIDTMLDAAGLPKPAVYINVEGDEWEETIDRSETLVRDCTLSAKEIIGKIAAAGIVGMGGATFPTQVKLSPPPGSKAEILIVNAVECEPYLTSDHSLMLAKGEEIIVGVKILMTAIDVRRAVIGIESNKPDAIKLMKKLAAKEQGIEVMPLKMRYPQGGEKQLIDAVIRRQVKSGALPISVGAVVQNVGTVFAVGLLASGLASTSVGAYAGSEIMNGLLHIRVPLWARRLVSLVPALAILAAGAEPTWALVVSQVALSFGIPFAIIPLVSLTRDRRVMGEHANSPVLAAAGALIAAAIVVLNLLLVYLTATGQG